MSQSGLWKYKSILWGSSKSLALHQMVYCTSKTCHWGPLLKRSPPSLDMEEQLVVWATGHPATYQWEGALSLSPRRLWLLKQTAWNQSLFTKTVQSVPHIQIFLRYVNWFLSKITFGYKAQILLVSAEPRAFFLTYNRLVNSYTKCWLMGPSLKDCWVITSEKTPHYLGCSSLWGKLSLDTLFFWHLRICRSSCSLAPLVECTISN